eukprot:6179699-Pleurochrysis_carterae.AAC.2
MYNHNHPISPNIPVVSRYCLHSRILKVGRPTTSSQRKREEQTECGDNAEGNLGNHRCTVSVTVIVSRLRGVEELPSGRPSHTPSSHYLLLPLLAH